MASIGLSKPYFSAYNESTGAYAGATSMGKATTWDLTLDSGSDNVLYGDNAPAESESQFAGGSISIGTTELDATVLVALLGITKTTETIGTASVEVLHFDDRQQIPYVGVAAIRKAMVGGVVKYQAIMLNKVKFSNLSEALETQGETISWNTPTIEGTVSKDNSTYHEWKKMSGLLESEAAAIAVIESWMAAPVA